MWSPLLFAASAGAADFVLDRWTLGFAVATLGSDVGDLDGDGDVDLVAGSMGGELTWYENDGRGGLRSRGIVTVVAAPAGAEALATTDLDGDGDLDFAMGDGFGDSVWWFENAGGGAFTQRLVFNDLGWAEDVHAVDLDLDGDIDLVAGGAYRGEVMLFENDGRQRFTERLLHDRRSRLYDLRSADLDLDGDVDLVSGDGDGVTWYENQAGAFVARVISTGLEVGNGAVPTDLDKDGDWDVVAIDTEHDPTLVWLENDGTQTFTTVEIPTDLSFPWAIQAADIDHDGDVDVAANSAADPEVRVFYDDGAQRFTEQVLPIDGYTFGLHVAELNGDGLFDLAALRSYGEGMLLAQVCSGDADGDVICDPVDRCLGRDASGDLDADGSCALDASGGVFDCDDAAPAVFPGAAEIPCDGVDNGCDGPTPEEADADADGISTCDGDCDDDDAAEHPGAVEVCGGPDRDCDGVPPEPCPEDTGTTATDGTTTDTGEGPAPPPSSGGPDEEAGEGCGCASTPAGALAGLAPLGVALLARRRRR